MVKKTKVKPLASLRTIFVANKGPKRVLSQIFSRACPSSWLLAPGSCFPFRGQRTSASCEPPDTCHVEKRFPEKLPNSVF